MSRYIDADTLLNVINRNIAEAHNERCAQILEAILYAPTADVVEVVRCKDCKHWGGVTYGQMCRKYSGAETKVCTEKDHYCSYGERRAEEGANNEAQSKKQI